MEQQKDQELAQIRKKLKELLVSSLNLEDIKPDDIKDDEILFGEGLGLDSIDALELVLGLEKEYGAVIPDAEVGKRVFQSVRTIARFILEQQGAS